MDPANKKLLAEKMLQMVSGHWVSQAIRAAAILGVADHLKGAARHYEELAKEVDANPQALYRLLRALAGLGIFEETSDQGVFQLTPLASLLRSDVEGSCKHAAIFLGSAEEYKSWGNIMHSLKTGNPAFDELHGVNAIDYAMTNPDFLTNFQLAMSSFSLVDSSAVFGAYDFSTAKVVMDVGGGLGHLLKIILEGVPAIEGIIFDLPPVVESAKEVLKPVMDRCKVVSGSFFNEVPSGADIIILKSVIHDWDDEFAQEILTNCKAALPQGGKLLLCERVIPLGNDPNPGKMMDLEKLVITPGGMERTAAEYTKLLDSSGFNVVRIIPTQCAMSVIEAEVQ